MSVYVADYPYFVSCRMPTINIGRFQNLENLSPGRYWNRITVLPNKRANRHIQHGGPMTEWIAPRYFKILKRSYKCGRLLENLLPWTSSSRFNARRCFTTS